MLLRRHVSRHPGLLLLQPLPDGWEGGPPRRLLSPALLDQPPQEGGAAGRQRQALRQQRRGHHGEQQVRPGTDGSQAMAVPGWAVAGRPADELQSWDRPHPPHPPPPQPAPFFLTWRSTPTWYMICMCPCRSRHGTSPVSISQHITPKENTSTCGSGAGGREMQAQSLRAMPIPKARRQQPAVGLQPPDWMAACPPQEPRRARPLPPARGPAVPAHLLADGGAVKQLRSHVGRCARLRSNRGHKSAILELGDACGGREARARVRGRGRGWRRKGQDRLQAGWVRVRQGAVCGWGPRAQVKSRPALAASPAVFTGHNGRRGRQQELGQRGRRRSPKSQTMARPWASSSTFCGGARRAGRDRLSEHVCKRQTREPALLQPSPHRPLPAPHAQPCRQAAPPWGPPGPPAFYLRLEI